MNNFLYSRYNRIIVIITYYYRNRYNTILYIFYIYIYIFFSYYSHYANFSIFNCLPSDVATAVAAFLFSKSDETILVVNIYCFDQLIAKENYVDREELIFSP